MEEILWSLFENTGKIEYYVRYKKILDEKKDGNSDGSYQEPSI